MSINQKLIDKFKNGRLQKEIDINEFIKYLKCIGFEIDYDRGKGSHIIAIHKKYGIVYPIPSKNGKLVSYVYVKEINKIIKNKEE